MASQEDLQIARDLYSELRGITAELKGQETEISKSRKAFRAFEDAAQKFKLNQQDISKLNDKELNDLSKKVNIQLEIARQEGERLVTQTSIGREIAKEVAEIRALGASQADVNDFVSQSLKLTGDLTEEQKALVAAHFDQYRVVEDINGELEKELAIRERANDLLGVSGQILKGIKGSLGPFAEAFNLDEVADAMGETADAIARGEQAGNKLTVALAGAGQAVVSMGKFLMDPAVIIGGLVQGFAKFEEQNRQVRQLTGQTATNFQSFNNSAISAVDAVKTIGSLSQEIGINVNAAFSSDTIMAATELSELLGLSAQETANMALRAEVFGEDLGAADDQAEAIVQNFAKQGKGALNVQQVLKGAGSASNSLALSVKGGQEGLLKAAANAQRLGINLQQAEAIADSLLDFEQSISNELEAELLTGKSLNLEKARTAALNNDIATLTEEIGNNTEIMEAFSSGNRIQQDAIAKSLGMSKDDVAKMIFLKQKENQLTDEQAAKAAGISVEEAKRLSATESINKSIEQLTAAFAPLLDQFAKIISSKAGMMAVKIIVGSLAAASVVKGVFGLSKSFTELGSSIKGAMSGMGSFLKTAKGAGGGVKGIQAGVKDALGMGGDAAKKAADATKGAAAGGAKQGQGAKGFLKGLGDGLASIGKQMANVVKGGLALGIVGVILGGSFALAMKMVENVDPVQMIAFAGALAIFGGTAALVGKLSSQIIQGSVALLALGVGLLGAGVAFSLIEGIDVKSLIAFSIALPLLALAAAGLGFIAPMIIAGSVALGALGLALIPAALGFSMIQELNIDSILAFAAGVGVMAATTAALGLASPLILAGSVALSALGLAMIPLSIGFERMAEANTEGLVQSLAAFAGLAPAMGLMAASLLGVAGGLGAIAIAGIAALPIVTALAGLGTVATGIAGVFGGEGEGEGGGESNPNAALEAKLDDLNKNVIALTNVVKSGGTVNIDGNRAGTLFAMGSSNLA